MPERIYIFDYNDAMVTPLEGDTTYVREDAFIDKACELLVDCIEDFMARRMEIWDEECKKQTLENLRNALKK